MLAHDAAAAVAGGHLANGSSGHTLAEQVGFEFFLFVCFEKIRKLLE